MSAHLSSVPFQAICGSDEVGQKTVHFGALTSTSEFICPRCVAMLHGRIETLENGMVWDSGEITRLRGLLSDANIEYHIPEPPRPVPVDGRGQE